MGTNGGNINIKDHGCSGMTYSTIARTKFSGMTHSTIAARMDVHLSVHILYFHTLLFYL